MSESYMAIKIYYYLTKLLPYPTSYKTLTTKKIIAIPVINNIEMDQIEERDITVIVTDFNRLRYIHYALSSLSINGNAEIIVVTNLDENKIKNNKVKTTYIYNKGKTYGDMIRVAIKESKGDILCFLEDDDIFYAHKLKYIKKLFNDRRGLSYYHNSYFTIDYSGKIIGNFLNKEKITFNPFNSYSEVKRMMNRNVDHNLSSITVNKQYINSKELANLSNINLSVDTYMFAISVKEGTELIDDNKILTGYRVHNSTSNPDSKNSIQNPYLRLHKMYSEDYKFSSVMATNAYLKDFLYCRYKIERLYYSVYIKKHILENVTSLIPCIKYLDGTTLKNRSKMFRKEYKK